MEKDPFVIQEEGGDIKDRKVSGFSRLKFDGSSIGEMPIASLKLPISSKKIRLLSIFILLIFVFLFSSLIFFQIIQGGYYRNLSEGNRIRVRQIKAPRGLIYDRNIKPLVKNVGSLSLVVTPSDLPQDKQELKKLEEEIKKILPNNALNVEETFQQFYQAPLFSSDPAIIEKNIPYQEGILLYAKAKNWPGVNLIQIPKREYIYPENTSHILGYLGSIAPEELKLYKDKNYTIVDYIGKNGVELQYEDKLRGEVGHARIEVDSLGKEKRVIDIIEPKEGDSLVLTIDIDLQNNVYEILGKYIKLYNLKRVAALVLDPTNGEILSLASMPTYNNNDFSFGISSLKLKELLQNPNKPLFNRAISGQYPPGSVFKPIVGATALEEGSINPNFKVNSVGGIKLGDRFFPDWKEGGHGITNIRWAIADSVNTFFYTIGGGYGDHEGLGVEKIVEYSRKFGLGSSLGLDLASEAFGFLPSKKWKEQTKGERWFQGDTYNISIGQGDILVTPLQVASYTSIFANSGTLFVPHIVKSAPKVIRQNFLKNSSLEEIREGMRDAVRKGSAKILRDSEVEVAGKTGTPEFSNVKEPHGWFTGFAPYKNPKIVVTVFMEESGGAGKALLVTKEIIKWYFDQKKHPPKF